MTRTLAVGTLLASFILAGPAMADQRCDVPLADWQPREAVQRKVEADGWKVTRIKADDGCYKVRATNDKGDRYKGTYHPGTLKLMKISIEYKEPR